MLKIQLYYFSNSELWRKSSEQVVQYSTRLCPRRKKIWTSVFNNVTNVFYRTDENLKPEQFILQ